MYIKTTEAIAEYVGREYNKAMRILVKHQKENIPVEPTEPTGTDVPQVTMKKYEKELSRYHEKLNQYEEYKAKVFVIIKGQCTLTMKNKIESMKGYQKIEENDDVIELLKSLKELAFTKKEAQYEFWTVNLSMRRALTMRQQNNESLAMFYKRFVNQVDITESQWGLIVPTKISTDKKTRDKFLACTFLAGVDRKKYGRVTSQLNNAYLAGQKNYPTTVEGAMTMLSHFMSENPRDNREEKATSVTEASFAQQQRSKVICFKCGERGHYANECNKERDDESSVNSRSSSRSSNHLMHWSK